VFQNTEDPGRITHGWEDRYSVRPHPPETFLHDCLPWNNLFDSSIFYRREGVKHLTGSCRVPYRILCQIQIRYILEFGCDVCINGHLHYTSDLDGTLNEDVVDKIRQYHVDYNNRPPNTISFMTAIPSTSGSLHSEFGLCPWTWLLLSGNYGKTVFRLIEIRMYFDTSLKARFQTVIPSL
jgi:hypothetical protein